MAKNKTNTTKTTEDPALTLAKFQAEEARKAREREKKRLAKQQARFDTSLSSAYDQAINEARQYFTERGLNPDEFMPEITQAATSARARVPNLDATPLSYFDGIGGKVYDTRQNMQRSNLGRTVDTIAPEGFERTRVADTVDDATLSQLLGEQRANADMYIKNLLKRGVINQSGYTGAARNLDQQGYAAQERLNEIGNGLIAEERTNLGDIASRARTGAANFELGDTFDPNRYGAEIDTSVNNFLSGLGGRLRGLIPTDLFKTSGLGAIAGAAQGAQNFRFDPAALAGTNIDDDDEEQTNFLNAF